MDSELRPAAYYDAGTGYLHVGALKTSDKSVLREAARWSTGDRGEPVPLAELAGADLSAFAREALALGARTLALVAADGDTRAVRQATKEASEQVAAAADRAARAADDAARRAIDSVTHTTKQAHETLMSEVVRLVGGDDPELLTKLRPLLTGVGTDLERQVAEAVRRASTEAKTETDRRHAELSDLVRGLQQQFAVSQAAKDAGDAIKNATTAKGAGYEDALHATLEQLAAGMGDEYARVGDTAGNLPRNRKGDGLLHVDGQGSVHGARVVIEAHDGSSKDWGSYLAEAERNRAAGASLGVVRHGEDNAGHLVRVIAPRRVVLAYDPANDSPELLRTVLLLLRTVALTATGRFGTEQVGVAGEHVREALAVLNDLDEAKRSAAAITGHAEKIEKTITKTVVSIQRELDTALAALAGGESEEAQR